MNAIWQATEKTTFSHEQLVDRLGCGTGSLEAWCHAQSTAPQLKYPLRHGICFLRSYASWVSGDGSTEISVPAFCAGEKEFKLVAMIHARSQDGGSGQLDVHAEVLRLFVGKLIPALREDILETRLSHF